MPSLIEIAQRVKADIDNALGVVGTSLKRSVTGALARAFAGAVYGLYGYLNYIILQIFPDTADGIYLERWAKTFGLEKKAASFAQGTIKFTGTNSTVIPQGTQLKVDNQTFETIQLVTIASGEATVDVLATVAGVDGNFEEGEVLNLTSAIAGVNSKATVQEGGISGGANEESIEELRARLLSRLSQPPMGGAAADYKAWTLAVDASITRAWVYSGHLGQDNSVGVTFVQDDNDPIIPNAASIAEVQSYLDDSERKPVTAEITVFAPTTKALDLQIQLKPNTSAVQQAVESSLKELIQREAEPGGADNLENDGTILLSRIREAISNAEGEEDHIIDLVNGLAPANVTVDTGELVQLGDITWLTLS